MTQQQQLTPFQVAVARFKALEDSLGYIEKKMAMGHATADVALPLKGIIERDLSLLVAAVRSLLDPPEA